MEQKGSEKLGKRDSAGGSSQARGNLVVNEAAIGKIHLLGIYFEQTNQILFLGKSALPREKGLGFPNSSVDLSNKKSPEL